MVHPELTIAPLTIVIELRPLNLMPANGGDSNDDGDTPRVPHR
jgi:hypothetical protein